MRLSHARRAISVRFDDPNLVSCAGLVPVMALPDRCGLGVVITGRLTVSGKGSANPAVKILALIAGMIAGADSISDMDLLRHGGWAGCSTRSGPRRRWARSCGCSPSATSANSTPSPALAGLVHGRSA
jgi:hypothetical protein